MNKRQILAFMTFGKRIAEEELSELSSYFVETSQWQRIWSGDVDIIYGAKGAGKSAIYSLLLEREDALFDRGILAVAAENPRGAPVFSGMVTDPPASEQEFRQLWKLYFLLLIAGAIREYGLTGSDAKAVLRNLESAHLIPKERNLGTILGAAFEYVKNFGRIESLEPTMQVDPNTGAPTFGGKITFREPTPEEHASGVTSVDELMRHAQNALEAADLKIWILLDRLDVAFADTPDLEKRALQALFRVYLDTTPFARISLKIFLRNDIWKRITGDGFREASHITKSVTINWGYESLLNLVVRRAIKNRVVGEQYHVNEDEVLLDSQKQRGLFYMMFPDQVDPGSGRPKTFDWILSRTRDGTKNTAPRELIHLLSATLDSQLRLLDMGNNEPPDGLLFDRNAIKEAIPEVSQARLEQTLYAEFPKLKAHLEKLDGAKTQQTPVTLAKVWEVGREEAVIVANQLVDIGFFERRGTREAPEYWVPFLYRDALHMVQGSAG